MTVIITRNLFSLENSLVNIYFRIEIFYEFCIFYESFSIEIRRAKLNFVQAIVREV